MYATQHYCLMSMPSPVPYLLFTFPEAICVYGSWFMDNIDDPSSDEAYDDAIVDRFQNASSGALKLFCFSVPPTFLHS